MSNPYTQPSISGYNASPPADDGTETSTNQVTWAKHKTKLADPIKTLVEGVDSAVLAAFGLVFGAAVNSQSGNYTVVTSDRGRFIPVTGSSTITLLAAATAGSGFPIAIVNTGTDTVTIDGDGSETINGSTTQSLFPGEGAIITSDGANWFGVISKRSENGSFTATPTGGTSGSPTTMQYEIRENLCTLYLPTSMTVVSTSTAFTATGLSSSVSPDTIIRVPCIVTDGAVSPTNYQPAMAEIAASATTITFYMGSPLSSTGFNSGGGGEVKGLPAGWSITYPLT